MSEEAFNDLCKRMLSTINKPVQVQTSDENQVDAPIEEPQVNQETRLTRRERRMQEKIDKKKEKKATKTHKNVSTNLEKARINHRISQFDESDRSRIEHVLFNK